MIDYLAAIVFGPAMAAGFVYQILASGFVWGRVRAEEFMDRRAQLHKGKS